MPRGLVARQLSNVVCERRGLSPPYGPPGQARRLASRPWRHGGLPGFVLLIALSGCGDSASSSKVQDCPYYPLQVGNKWVYQGPDHQRILQIVRHAEISDRLCAVVETREKNQLVSQEHVYADKDGLFVVALGGKTLTKPLPFLRLPATKGRSWKVNFKERGESSLFLVGAEQVTVPYGTFDTVTLRIDVLSGGVKTLSNYYWFAKDVGIVKHVLRMGEKTTEFELIEFRRGKVN